MATSVPADVLQFIREHIDRLETLDVLLRLHADSARRWTSSELSNELRSSVLSVETSMAVLVRRGLVAMLDGTYCFRARSPELEAGTQRLADCYRERRTAVVTAIFTRPVDAVRSFADAFRWKKDGSDG